MLRGDLYRLRVPKGLGHEQHGPRYGVIVQSDELPARSTILIAPTSRSALPASFRPPIAVGGSTTRVLVEQLGAFDLQRLGPLMRHLEPEEMWSVDEAIELVLGLR